MHFPLKTHQKPFTCIKWWGATAEPCQRSSLCLSCSPRSSSCWDNDLPPGTGFVHRLQTANFSCFSATVPNTRPHRPQRWAIDVCFACFGMNIHCKHEHRPLQRLSLDTTNNIWHSCYFSIWLIWRMAPSHKKTKTSDLCCMKCILEIQHKQTSQT